MIFPICGFDAKNAVLCPQCEAKVENGELTKADVEASITLAKIAKSNKEIENFSLFSCKDFGGNFILSMAKNDIKDFDATAANNTDINSVNIAEGCAPSGINNAIRELMADLKNALFAKINVTADTSAGDDAAIGYTAAEGLILTGQGSTNDVTH